MVNPRGRTGGRACDAHDLCGQAAGRQGSCRAGVSLRSLPSLAPCFWPCLPQLIMGEDGTDRGVRKIARLHAAANWMRLKLLEFGLAVEGDWDSPVIPMMLINTSKIGAFSRLMLERGVAVVVVGFPATALLKGRVRLCISAGHNLADMRYAFEAIKVRIDLADVCLAPGYLVSKRRARRRVGFVRAVCTWTITPLSLPLPWCRMCRRS